MSERAAKRVKLYKPEPSFSSYSRQGKGKGREDIEENVEEQEQEQERELYASSGDEEDPERVEGTVSTQDEEGVEKSIKKKNKFVAEHGNYRGYYNKRRFQQDPYIGDERLALIPRDWIENKRVLDVGCNTGKVTVEIAQTFQPYRVTGVDIDNDLIKGANKQCRIAWSAQEPLGSIRDAAQKIRERNQSRRRSISRSPSPIEADDLVVPRASYFPAGLSRMYGYLPQVPSEKLLRMYVKPTEEESKQRSQRRDGRISRGNVMPTEVALFPHNLRFKHADWVNEEITADKRGYDCIIAFSVSKWIHLNGGDAGLMEFFTRVFKTLLPSGRFILEPQPWSSYEKARKMSENLKESYHALKLRPEGFEKILLQEIGFKSMEYLSETDEGGFKRPLHVYHKAAGSWL